MFLTAQGGLLGPIAWVFGKLLNLIYNLLAGNDGMANLGICIILFTIVVRIILFPLNFKQQKSSKINMIIQPEIQKIQKKYNGKKDQESLMKQQQEMQAVYDKYGTSMTGGCLTTLIQFPILIAFYRVIQNIPAYVGKIKDMYAPIAEGLLNSQGKDAQQFLIDFVDEQKVSGAAYAIRQFQDVSEVTTDNVIDVLSNFGVSHLNTLAETLNLNVANNIDKIDQIHSFFLGINISEAPGYRLSWALLIPISSAFFNYLSMKISTGRQENADPTANSMMKSMMITMPLMSIFICISLPAGIGIYWSVGALISLITQLIINAYYDHADMDKILEEQIAKAEAKKAKNGGKKSFMERLMDSSAEAQEELNRREAMRKNSSATLKNYVASESSQEKLKSNQNRKYKEGSISAKANIMLNYNNSNKEEK